MKNIVVQLIKRKTVIEADPAFEGATTRIIAYVSLEFDNGIIINEICIRQDVNNRADIRVIFPFKRAHDVIIPYITFSSEAKRKEMIKEILTKLKIAMENELFSDSMDVKKV